MEESSKEKTKKFVFGIAAIAVAALFIAAYFFFPTKPFSRLNTDDIQQILVYTIPQGIQVELTPDEIDETVNLLKDLTVYQPNYKADFTTGQVVRYTVIYTDNTSVEIVISANVSLALSGKSYRGNYKSLEALNAFANRVVT